MVRLASRVLLLPVGMLVLGFSVLPEAAIQPPTRRPGNPAKVATAKPLTQSPGTYISVNPGGSHTCAIAKDGAAYCWGANRFGQLGVGAPGPARTTPQAVVGGIKFANLAAGMNHTCGISVDGDAYCWGYNSYRQLGTRTTVDSASPVKVMASVKFRTISAGYLHTCGIAQDAGGRLLCWGDNRDGQLGTGGSAAATTPSLVRGFEFASVSAGSASTCGRTTEGKLYCWGNNDHAALGAASADTCPQGKKQTACSRNPIAVDPATQYRALSVGQGRACATTVNGETRCWGWQFGNRPTKIEGAASFDMLAAGGSHACGLFSGDVTCWGFNTSGELGNGTKDRSNTPVPVSGGHKFGSVRAWSSHTCAITTSQTLYCWGANLDGQLGNGSTAESLVPVRVP